MRDGYSLDLGSWRGRCFLAVLVFLLSWSSSFLSNFIHEVLGHGLATLLFGGGFHGFYLSPIATSAAYLSAPVGGFPPIIEGFISASGVLAQFILGGLPLALLSRFKGFPARLAILIFSWTGLLNAGTYIFDSTATAILYDIRGTSLDSVGMSVHLGIPLESFLAIGFIASSLPTYYIFTRFLGFVGKYHLIEGKKTSFLSLMTAFFATRTIMVLSGFLLEPAPEFYLVELTFVLSLLASHAALASLRVKPLHPPEPLQIFIPGRFIDVVCLLAVATTLLWIGVFGVSVDVAHGIFFDKPPWPRLKGFPFN